MYQVSKYPTLKLFRFGQVMKKEYRGQRSVDAFFSFVRDQLENPVNIVQSLDDLDVLDVSIGRVELVDLFLYGWSLLILLICLILLYPHYVYYDIGNNINIVVIDLY